MKIVNISYEANPFQTNPDEWISGARYFIGIWEAIASHHEVVFFEFIRHTGNIQRNGVTYRFQNLPKLALLLPFRLNREIIQERPDVVIVHGMKFPLQILLLKLQWGKRARIVVQDHSNHPFRNWLKKALQRLADRYAESYYFTGRGLADGWLAARLINDKKKVTEIMEVSSVFHQEDKMKARAKIGINASNVYLWVGHLNTNKNPMLAVRAFTRFVQEKAAELYIIFQTGDLLEEIKTFCNRNPLASRNIHLIGKVPHESMQSWYSAADFIISTSWYESCGLSVCEGMSCGCIPIATDIPSFRYMTNDSGILFEPGNEDGLVAALHQSNKMDRADVQQSA